MSCPDRQSCTDCNRFGSALHYAVGDLSNAKGKFIRHQNAKTHQQLVQAKAEVKKAQTSWDEHCLAANAGQVAS